MKKIFRYFFFTVYFSLFITFLLYIIQYESPLYSQLKNYNYYSYQNLISGSAKIIDGDSISIDGNEIRLYGIDAPEISQKCFDNDHNIYKCGIISKNHLAFLIGDNFVKCFYQKKDVYDRYLANCYIGKDNINYKMIESGMAIIYNPITNNDKMLHNLEDNAKRNKKGIWNGYFMIPKSYRKYNKY